jgi:hypothetical protein
LAHLTITSISVGLHEKIPNFEQFFFTFIDIPEFKKY